MTTVLRRILCLGFLTVVCAASAQAANQYFVTLGTDIAARITQIGTPTNATQKAQLKTLKACEKITSVNFKSVSSGVSAFIKTYTSLNKVFPGDQIFTADLNGIVTTFTNALTSDRATLAGEISGITNPKKQAAAQKALAGVDAALSAAAAATDVPTKAKLLGGAAKKIEALAKKLR